MGSMTAIAVAAWLGAAADTRGPSYAIWHLGSAAFALAFNLGSFVVEYAVIVAHVRLLTELKDRADRLREERYGLAEVARRRSRSGNPPAPNETRRSLFHEESFIRSSFRLHPLSCIGG